MNKSRDVPDGFDAWIVQCPEHGWIIPSLTLERKLTADFCQCRGDRVIKVRVRPVEEL